MNRLMLASLAITSVQACDIIPNVTHTFFGFPDNQTPGPIIAFNCGRGLVAGGVGTFDDPLTFASAPGLFSPCEVIFDPFLRKFLRFEDICAQCVADFEAGIPHIDVWIGSNETDGGQAQIDCEMSLTPAVPQSIIRNPNANLRVDSMFCPLLYWIGCQ